MEEGLDAPFEFGPYPKDVLTYKSNRVVEFRTAASNRWIGNLQFVVKEEQQPNRWSGDAHRGNA